MTEAAQPDLTALTVQLLSAYVANNTLPSSELPALIESTRKALSGEAAQADAPAPDHVPAVSVRKSLASRDHLISMIDGKPYKSLKRHLGTHGLTPAEYRQRYGLAADYPMVAPGYSEQRREVARRLGLGRKKSGVAKATSKDGGAADASVTEEPARQANSPEPVVKEGAAPQRAKANAAKPTKKVSTRKKAASARPPREGTAKAETSAEAPARGRGKLKPVYSSEEPTAQSPDPAS